jgi:glycosyltransferase involved in cell wall biosynthesis
VEIIVDGIIYQSQSKGGISRLFSEILPRMCDMDESLHITLLTSGRRRQALPAHPRIRRRFLLPVERFLPPGRLWKPVVPRARAIIQRLGVGNSSGRIWHSTYYTMPEKWDGPVVISVVDMIHERFPNLFDGLGSDQFVEQKRRCVLAADAVICISKTTLKDVQQFYGIDTIDPARMHVVPLATSEVFRKLNDAHYSIEPLMAKPFFLYVGARAHYKNFSSLLFAYSVWPKRKEVDLIVVGNGWSRDEEQYLVRLGISDQVHLFMNIDDDSLCSLYNQATAFTYPSLYEGFGIPILEAMACGCPIVASRIPATIEVAGECPIYFEPTEPEDLLAAMDLALSEGRDSRRVRLGLEHVKHYSWDKTARQTLDVYHALSNLN